jgi:glycosyltransferase involved in cell wall biosynthesis
MDKVKGFDCLVIQYHPAFFDVQILAQICAVCEKDQVPLYVFIHNTGFLRPFSHEPAHVKVVSRLNKARRIFVHSVYELNNLKTFGLVDNVTLFPHGATKGDKISPICDTSGKVTIASYGFFLKHKGLFELIEALGSIRRRYDVQLLLVNALHPEGRSVEFYQQCRDLIASLDMEEHVRLVPDFLPDAESLQHLMAADIIVFPYQYSDEGASGAVRFGLRADRLVACSPLPIFDDIADAVQMLPGTSPAQIAAGIIRLIDKKKSWPEMLERQRNWLEAHSWAKLSKRLSQVIFADLQWLRWGSKHSLQ